MHIDEKAVPGGTLHHPFVIADHPLVAAVHEVDLHSGNPPLLQRREEPVHVLLDRQPRQPKYDLHVALPAVGDQLLQIEIGIGMEDVGRRSRPALVHDDVGNTVSGGEVDVVTVGFGIAPGPEIDARQAHAVPPVPADQPRFHPLPVGVGRRFGEQPDQLILQQGGVLFRNDRHTPREGARSLGAGDIRLLRDDLQIAVAGGGILLGHTRKQRFEAARAVAPDEQAGVIAHIGFGQQHFLTAGHSDQHRQVAHTVRRIVFRRRHTGIRLLVHRPETVHLGKPRFASGRKSQPARLAHDLDLARKRRHETVGRTVVEQPELHGVTACEIEPHGIVTVAHRSVLGRITPFEHLVGRRTLHAPQAGLFAQRPVGKRQ